MNRMTNESEARDGWIGMSAVVDVFDSPQLFELLDNEKVVEMSRLNGDAGFSSTDSVRKSTGISVRRIMALGLTAVDLALALLQQLQRVTGLKPGDFETILLCHSHTDSSECGRLAAAITQEWSLDDTTVRPFNYGCCGFLKMLEEASEILEDASTDARVLVLSVETPETWHDAADRLFCGLVSAGATAAVVEKGRGHQINVVRTADFEIPDDRRPNPRPLFHQETGPVFTFRGQPVHRTVMRMNSEPVFLNGIELMLNNLRAAMLTIDYQPGQRVVVAPHQPSGKLLRALVAAARKEFPDVEFLNNLDRYGNTISSSVPTVVSRLSEVLTANGRRPLQDGDHLILLAAGICMQELNNHMTAGYACVRWRSLFAAPPVATVQAPAAAATLAEA